MSNTSNPMIKDLARWIVNKRNTSNDAEIRREEEKLNIIEVKISEVLKPYIPEKDMDRVLNKVISIINDYIVSDDEEKAEYVLLYLSKMVNGMIFGAE